VCPNCNLLTGHITWGSPVKSVEPTTLSEMAQTQYAYIYVAFKREIEESVVAHNWEWLGCIFFATTVLTTIGYGNYSPQSTAARVLLTILTIPGVGVFGYGLSQVAELVTHGVAELVQQGGYTSKDVAEMDIDDWHHLVETHPKNKRGGYGLTEVLSAAASAGFDGTCTVHGITEMHELEKRFNEEVAKAGTEAEAEGVAAPVREVDEEGEGVAETEGLKAQEESEMKDILSYGRMFRNNEQRNEPSVYDDDHEPKDEPKPEPEPEPDLDVAHAAILLYKFSKERNDVHRHEEKVMACRAATAIGLLFILIGVPIFAATLPVGRRDALDALYFCIITLSTVGLGDLVPEMDVGTIVFWVFYVVIGLGMIGHMISELSDITSDKSIDEEMIEQLKKKFHDAITSLKQQRFIPHTPTKRAISTDISTDVGAIEMSEGSELAPPSASGTASASGAASASHRRSPSTVI